MAHLNAYDEEVLREASTTLYSNHHLMRKADPQTLSAILFSLMKLRYKYIELIDSIIDVIMSKPEGTEGTEKDVADKLPVELITSLIVSCGTLNHVPERWKRTHLLDLCIKKVQESSKVDPKTWLNTVYALVVLDLADQSVMLSVLSKPGNNKMVHLTPSNS